MQKKTWQVRVYRKTEDVINVQAETAQQAEQLAKTLPNVISVLTGMTVSGDKPAGQVVSLQGIEDDSDDD